MKRSFKKTLEGKASPTAPEAAEERILDGSTEALIGRYSGMSESELMRELMTATSRQKAEGKFDPDAVKKGMDAIMPMLDDAQKRKLREIVGKL